MTISRESMAGRVAAEIRRRIISGELPGGTALRQEWLATTLGVSRIPVREAIRQLEAEGLVQSEPHKGTVVSELSAAEVEELFEIRMRLEPWLFGLAIPRMSEADIDRAEAIILESETGGTIETWGEFNWRIHAALYEPAGRGQAMRLLRTVHHQANRYINLQLVVVAEDMIIESRDHRELAALARARDVRVGVAALERHIERVAASLAREIGRCETDEAIVVERKRASA